MSLATWKEEFYPIDAKRKMTSIQATEHSLKKWIGLRDVNLEKHGLVRDLVGNLSDGINYFHIDGKSCALCQIYVSQRDTCVGCPLYTSRGFVPCDGGDDPFGMYKGIFDPEPMIEELEKALSEIKDE